MNHNELPANQFGKLSADFFNKRIFYNVLPIVIISSIMPYSMGRPGIGNTLLTFFILLSAKANKITHKIIGFIFLAFSMYIPVGLQYGKLKYSFLISALQTNISESQEFFGELDYKSLYVMAICMIAIVFYLCSKPLVSLSRKKQWFAFIMLIALSFNSYPKRMASDIVQYSQQAHAELDLLQKSLTGKDTFTGVTFTPKYKNVVVIIGESVTADYLSLYGYSHDTTPWLRTTAGYFATNYVSAAPNTYMSLPRTLSISDGLHQQTNNNVVTLSNKAGMETYWLSNQGYVGEFDTPSTVIAYNAAYKIFLKSGDYNSNDTDDFELLDKLKSVVYKKTNKAIFMHMIGSHPDSCDRLNGYPITFNIQSKEKINCYLATINKLDSFVHQTIDILNSSGESYALVYFSDHGMTVDTSERPVRHGAEYQQNYKVPFFIMTSDKKDRTVINEPISAYSFLAIYEWLAGIHSQEVAPVSIDKSSTRNIQVFNGDRLMPFSELPNNIILN